MIFFPQHLDCSWQIIPTNPPVGHRKCRQTRYLASESLTLAEKMVCQLVAPGTKIIFSFQMTLRFVLIVLGLILVLLVRLVNSGRSSKEAAANSGGSPQQVIGASKRSRRNQWTRPSKTRAKETKTKQEKRDLEIKPRKSGCNRPLYRTL